MEQNERGERYEGVRLKLRGQMVCMLNAIVKILTFNLSATETTEVLSRGIRSDMFNKIFLTAVYKIDCRECGL